MLFFLLAMQDDSNHEKLNFMYKSFYSYLLKYSIKRFREMGRPNYMFDAEDAVQNTFLKITRNVESIDFSAPKNQLKNFAFAILSNEIVNILRQGGDEENEEINVSEAATYDFIDNLEIEERYAEIVTALGKMDEKYSTTLYLLYIEGKSADEVARLMGLSTKTVYTRAMRAKKILYDYLKGGNGNG